MIVISSGLVCSSSLFSSKLLSKSNFCSLALGSSNFFGTDNSILSRKFEIDLWNRGFPYVVGVDESGRGCIAGPVISAAVCISPNSKSIEEVNDSKLVSEKARKIIYENSLLDSSIVACTAIVEHDVVDQINILQASLLSMSDAILKVRNELHQRNSTMLDSQMFAIIDGNKCPNKLPISSKPLVRGDSQCYSIALASIYAKVERDKIMVRINSARSHY